MNQDIFFRVSTDAEGWLVAHALRHPIQVRATSARELRVQAQTALAAHLGPAAWSRRITLVRSHSDPALGTGVLLA